MKTSPLACLPPACGAPLTEVFHAGYAFMAEVPLELPGNPRIQGSRVDIRAIESPFTVSTREVIAEEITISPNPATHFIQPGLPPAISMADFTILDAQGRMVQSGKFVAGANLQVGYLPGGFYTLKLMDGERVYVGKFIRQ